MHLVLIAVGIGLVAFGAVVLVRYADRAGGTFKWLGIEMTSTSAGLPLIALGVAAIAFAVTRGDGAPTPAPADTTASTRAAAAGDSTCLAATFDGVARDRVATVEAGMRDAQVVRRDQPQDTPFGLVLTEDGRRIGALRVRRYGSGASVLFKIESAVDAECRAAAELENLSRGGDPRAMQNWDTIRLRLGARRYDIRLGGEGDVNVEFLGAGA
jgi:hypothetical protein